MKHMTIRRLVDALEYLGAGNTSQAISILQNLRKDLITQPFASPMFEQVKSMNTAFGNPEGDPYKINADRLYRQCSNIASEYAELMRAFGVQVEFRHIPISTSGPTTENLNDVRDALCDIMVFALGAYHFMGIDADRDMESVVSAVLTRFCANQEQFDATVEHYDAHGVDFEVYGEFPYVYLKSAKDQGNGEYPKGKFLKSVGYRQPTFYNPAPKVDPVAEMAAQRAAHAAERAEKKRIRDAKILEYTNKLLAEDGEAVVNEHEHATAGGANTSTPTRKFIGQAVRVPSETGGSASVD